MPFTPGPWYVGDPQFGKTPVCAWGDLRVYGARSAKAPEIEDDARLIAAAPELYESLREAMECADELAHYLLSGTTFDFNNEHDERHGHEVRAIADKLRAAIAKAEGK